MTPINQTSLYGHNLKLLEFVDLFNNGKLPNKILLTGQKGIGKSTLAFHLVNCVLSKNEEFSYDLENFTINEKNRTFKLIQNKSNQNFSLIDIDEQKKTIDIQQIRNHSHRTS
tara:strand:- start:18 stop:356 length:339 start_codon:yes stop_codon:yes gene_type:complete